MLTDRVVSFSPSRALRTQSGSSTPNPAPESSGPVSFRKRNAPGVSRSTAVGADSRSAPSSSPNSRAAAPSPASSSSTGSAPTPVPPVPGFRNAEPSPAHRSAAETIRLGSSADCSANSTRHGSPSGSAGSASRKQVRIGPAGIRAPSSHASRSAASAAASVSSWGVVASRRASVAVRAITNRSGQGTRAGARPRLALSSGPGSRVRAAASARPSSAAASSDPGGSEPAARHDGGIAAARSRARWASAPSSTGRQRAAYPPSSATRTGSTRPRTTRPSAKRARAAR